jgi:hypothetical protein
MPAPVFTGAWSGFQNMKKTDGESSRSAGQPCPALQKLQGSGNKSAGNGGELQVVQATPTELAAIIQCLKERAESASADAHIGRASALARTGLRFVAVVLLAAGVGIGLGDGDLFDDVGPGVAQQPNRLIHNTDVRQAGEQPGGKAPGSGGGGGSGSDDSGSAGKPECEARATMCVFRLPDGRCQATEQPCRLLAECHLPLDDIKAMLEEIRAGVVGLAPVPPLAKDNEFCRAGSHWDVTFDGGRTFHLRHTLGVEYLNYLLHHPGQPISAYDLETTIRPDKSSARAKDSIQLNLDTDAVRDYLRQLEQLRAQRNEAAEGGDLATAGRLDDDIEAIEIELTKNRLVPDAGERARGNVRKAIVAVQDKLSKGSDNERRFHQHLEQFVSLGYECSYHQPPGIPWA